MKFMEELYEKMFSIGTRFDRLLFYIESNGSIFRRLRDVVNRSDTFVHRL